MQRAVSSVVSILLAVMATCICHGLRANSVPPASSAAFAQLCQVTVGTKGTVSADILFGMARSQTSSDDDQAATAAFLHLFEPVPLGAELFTRAASEFASFGELASTDPARAASLSQVAVSVNAHFGGLYRGKTECLRSTMCTPQLWGSILLACAQLAARSDPTRRSCSDYDGRWLSSHGPIAISSRAARARIL